jgi:hypothetical protein
MQLPSRRQARRGGKPALEERHKYTVGGDGLMCRNGSATTRLGGGARRCEDRWLARRGGHQKGRAGMRVGAAGRWPGVLVWLRERPGGKGGRGMWAQPVPGKGKLGGADGLEDCGAQGPTQKWACAAAATLFGPTCAGLLDCAAHGHKMR